MTAMLAEAKIDARPMLEQAKIDAALLKDPQGGIKGSQELGFQLLFADRTKDLPGFWIKTGFEYRLMSYGPLGMAVLAASNVTEGLKVLDAFQALTFSLMNYVIEEDGPNAICLRAEDNRSPEELKPFLHERALGSVTRFLNDMIQRPFPLKRIEYQRSRPSGWSEHESMFDVPVIFDAPSTRWVFEDGAGSLPLPMASPLLEETYQQICNRLVGPEPQRDRFLRDVYELMIRSGREIPSAKATAKKLGMSERGFYRYLDERGTSYREIVENVRLQNATRFLESSSLTIEQIGEMLGFSETSSFSRAFKRWTGYAPSDYRRKADV